jgi:NADPH2:quinone reductase
MDAADLRRAIAASAAQAEQARGMTRRSKDSMKAAYIERTGPAREVLQVGEQPDPSPKAGEVLVRVHVSGVNPSDVKTRGGASDRPPFAEPVMIHNDGAGEIVAVGDGVDKARIGQRVWLHNTDWVKPLGTAAELVAVSADDAEPLLDGYGYDEGACFGVPLLTAYHGVMVGGPVGGKTVFVTGGAGAVGHFCIQIAKAKGATVLASVSSDAKAAAAKAAGADHTVNYRSEDVPTFVNEVTGGKGLDHYIEVNLSVNGPMLEAIMGYEGRIAVYGSDDATATFASRVLRVKQAVMYFYNVYALRPDILRAAKDDLAEMMKAKRIETLIAERFPLDRIAEAHEAVEGGKLIGNAVVEIG